MEKELKNLQQQQATLKATNEQQDKLRQTLFSLQNELNGILVQGKNRAEKIRQLESGLAELPAFDAKLKMLKSLEKQKEQYSFLLQKKLELENKLTVCKSSLALKNQQTETLEKNLNEIKSHLLTLEEGSAKCPTCGQIINKGQKQQLKKEYLDQEKILKSKITNIETIAEENQIIKLQKDINSILIDDHKYQETIKKLSELSDLQEKREKLIAAQATLESEKKVVHELRQIFVSKKSQIEKLEKDVKKLPNLEKDLTDLDTLVTQKESLLNNLRLEEKDARNLLGQANELVSRVEQMEKLAKTKLEEKSNLQKDKESFEELALAFGKKGIQAMIIEAAIPEIEQEANSLLTRLTEGRMQVALATQRETKTLRLRSGQAGEEKSPGIIETLDIIISDEMGERNYENWSGGEKFRVDFAIRLAISKLLTNRAGAKLQFLVIDEGFGSQDAPGRARLIEAVDTIKDDFAKILIITHIEELKMEFPIRIEVSKSTAGSTFAVVGV